MSARHDRPPGLLKQISKDLDHYWYGCGSPAALGILRILIGFLTAIDLLVLGLHWQDWFGERGFVPRSLAQAWFVGDPYVWYPKPGGSPTQSLPIWQGGLVWPKINLLVGITNPFWAQAFFWAVFVCAILTMLGLWTRLSAFLLTVGIISIHHRDPLILMGGDTVIRICCVYLTLSPCGTVFSVDRLIALWKGRIQPVPVVVSLWVQRLITYNIALIYITTVWLKWYGLHWHGFGADAVYYAASLPEFYRFPFPRFILQMPFVVLVTWGALFTEFSLGTLVFFRPFRKYVLAAGVFLHGFIEYSMNVPLFGYLMVSLYICFFDGEEIIAWFRNWIPRLSRFRVTLSLPEGKRLRPNAAAVLRAVDPFQLVSYEPGAGPNLSAVREDGSSIGALWAIVSRSVGAWPFAAVPWAWTLVLENGLEDAPFGHPSPGSSKPDKRAPAGRS